MLVHMQPCTNPGAGTGCKSTRARGALAGACEGGQEWRRREIGERFVGRWSRGGREEREQRREIEAEEKGC